MSLPKPLSLVLTMIPGPADNLMLALVDPDTGRRIDSVELATHNNAEDLAPGEALVTVTVYAKLVPPATDRPAAN